MQRIALAWLVLELSGSAFALGLVTALQFAPMLVFAPWAGALADRYDKRRMLLVTQGALAIQTLVLTSLAAFGQIMVWHLAVFSLLLGMTKAFDAPARQSYVGDLVGKDLVQNAVALNAASFNAARLIGPAIAGVLLAAWGASIVFALNGLSFVVFIVALAGIRVSFDAAGSTTRSTVREGIRLVWGRPDLLVVIAVAGFVAMMALNFQMNIAVMTAEEFNAGPQLFGLLASAMAIGSLGGSLLASRRVVPSVTVVLVSGGALGALTALAGVMPTAITFGVVLVLCGGAALTMMTGANAYLQVNAGQAHRGRVMALYLAVFFGTTPLGAPLVGWFAATWGGRWALVIAGLSALAGVLLAWWVYRRHDRLQGQVGVAATGP